MPFGSPTSLCNEWKAEAIGALLSSHEAPGLSECWGEEFEELYTRYESEGRERRTVKAQDLWFAILDAQIETGTPYILYKDAANRKSNQQNLGTIKSSNLCTEIIEYTSADEIAVCNLASLALPRFVSDGKFDHQKLYDVTYEVTKNLNKIIDHNYYPVEEARNSNLRHRPIGLGVQGLADAFILLRLPFESDKAKQLNREIFETIYFAAMTASKDLAKAEGRLFFLSGARLQRHLPVRSVECRTQAALGLVPLKDEVINSAFATLCWWRRCQQPLLRKFLATMNASSLIPPTSMYGGCSAENSSWSISTF